MSSYYPQASGDLRWLNYGLCRSPLVWEDKGECNPRICQMLAKIDKNPGDVICAEMLEVPRCFSGLLLEYIAQDVRSLF